VNIPFYPRAETQTAGISLKLHPIILRSEIWIQQTATKLGQTPFDLPTPTHFTRRIWIQQTATKLGLTPFNFYSDEIPQQDY
jgi:hypothetical protein